MSHYQSLVESPPYRVERVPDRDPAHFPALLATFMTLAVVFVVWRTVVVNWHVWFGPVAWLAEMFGVLTTVLFILTVRKAARPEPRTVTTVTRTVDILVPTANEPLPVLEPTVIGAINVRGVRDVIVLDDGVRPEVREMAHRLGVRYLPRVSNEGAKAGNMNHGLLATDAEFLVTLDADHVPLPEFIEQTLGYFDDPSVGLVQSPQSFYNTDSFTFRRRRGRAAGWHEQEMFYGGVQPTKNATNSAFYTGTSAMLRRAALDSVDGFATGTPTEDIHTSLRLHARGWQSVYLQTPLAYGLEVENLRQYYGTRCRWAAGSLRLLLRHPDSPLRVPGLTLAQRLNYVSATAAHLQGLNRVLYLVAPIAAVVTGVPPIEGSYALYGFAFLAFMVLSIWTTVQFGRGHYHLLYSEAFGVADTVPMLAGLRGLIGAPRKFEVSTKRTGRVTGAGLKAAYRVYAGITLLALGLAVTRLIRGEYVDIAAWSAAFLALSTVYVLTFLVTMERYERRSDVPSYTAFTPAELYQHIVASSRRRQAVLQAP